MGSGVAGAVVRSLRRRAGRCERRQCHGPGNERRPAILAPHATFVVRLVTVPDAQGIELMTQLRVLDVSNNRLSSLPSLGALTQLQVRLS